MFDETCIDPLPFFCIATVRCMILVSEPKSWMEALKHCRDRYVDLASLSTAMEQQVAENKVKDIQSTYVWIGLNFIAGSWIWVSGDNIQYVNWVTGGNLQCPVANLCGLKTAQYFAFGPMFNFIFVSLFGFGFSQEFSFWCIPGYSINGIVFREHKKSFPAQPIAVCQ